MANYDTLFSFALKANGDEAKFLVDLISSLNEDGEIPADPVAADICEFWEGASLNVSFRVEDGKFYIWSNECPSVGMMCDVLEAYLTKFQIDEAVTFTWAETCSSMRPGAFGGGAAVVRRGDVRTFSVDQWILQNT